MSGTDTSGTVMFPPTTVSGVSSSSPHPAKAVTASAAMAIAARGFLFMCLNPFTLPAATTVPHTSVT